MKKLLLIVLLFGYNSLTAQVSLPPNPKAGDCFIKCNTENGTTNWKKLDCKLLKELKENYIPKGVKSLQFKLINLGYKLEPTNFLDEKTIDAFIDFKKNERKRTRKLKRKKRKRKKHS